MVSQAILAQWEVTVGSERAKWAAVPRIIWVSRSLAEPETLKEKSWVSGVGVGVVCKVWTMANKKDAMSGRAGKYRRPMGLGLAESLVLA